MTLSTLIHEHEAICRLSVFIGTLSLIALWESLAPLKQYQSNKAHRWLQHLTLVFFNNMLIRLILPSASTGIALFASAHGIGLFNFFDVNGIIAIPICLLLLDLVIYGQHIAFHKVHFLWLFHQVHHADLQFDTTTGIRFHPVEILFSALIKVIAILVLGPSVMAVMLFEMILNASSLFNHGNISLPDMIENGFRKVIVTPDMHRIHHSNAPLETNSNFGFNLSVWDKIFGTYCAKAKHPQAEINIGLKQFSNSKQTQTLLGLLALPFSKA